MENPTLRQCAEKDIDEKARALKEDCEEIEEEQDERIYHSKGWRREFWIASVGMTAVSSFPEEDPESTDKEVKMRFRSINTGFRAICTFHLLGESENRRKLLKVRSILSQTGFAIFLSVDSGRSRGASGDRACASAASARGEAQEMI